MHLPSWADAVLLSGLITGGGWGLVLLAKIAATLGRIDERLDGHDNRIARLESAQDHSPFTTRHSRDPRS